MPNLCHYNVKLIVQATPEISEPYNTKYLVKRIDNKLMLPSLDVELTARAALDDLIISLIECDPKWTRHLIKLFFIDEKFNSDTNVMTISVIYGFMMMPEMRDVFISDAIWIPILELPEKKDLFWPNDFSILQKGMTMI